VPLGNGGGVLTLSGAAMFTLYVKAAVFGVPLLSVTRMPMFTGLAAVVGVPLKTPVGLKLRPEGKLVALQAMGKVPPCC